MAHATLQTAAATLRAMDDGWSRPVDRFKPLAVYCGGMYLATVPNRGSR
jgi:hypothetical protein